MRNWKYHVNIKPFITEETSGEAIVNAGHAIAKALRAGLPEKFFDWDSANYRADYFLDCVDYFELLDLDTLADDELEVFNDNLRILYDFCDDNDIWLGF